MLTVRGVPGNEKVFRQIAGIPANMTRGLKSANLLIGRQVTRDIRKDMQPPKSGRTYIIREFWRGDRLIRHKASAPGEAPAVLSGSLRASVGYIPSSRELEIGSGNKGSGVSVVSKPRYFNLAGQIGFGRTVDYARKLELRMNRPYLKKNITRNFRNIENYYYRQIARKVFRI